MNELQSRQSEDVRDIGRDDIFSQVMGPDKGGRVRMYGLGVTPSDAWGEVPSRNSCYRMAMGYKDAFEKLEKRFTDEIVELKMAIHQRQQDSSPRPTSPLEPSRTTLFSSQHSLNNINRQHRLQVGATVSLRSTGDPTKIVAIGCLDSLNPLYKIGGQELGPNWCGVRINTPMEWDEQLIRPYGDFKLIEDVIGISIAWPVSLCLVALLQSQSNFKIN